VPLETPLFEKPTTQNEGVTRIALLKIEVSRGALHVDSEENDPDISIRQNRSAREGEKPLAQDDSQRHVDRAQDSGAENAS
jgi:hypothetical protein